MAAGPDLTRKSNFSDGGKASGCRSAHSGTRHCQCNGKIGAWLQQAYPTRGRCVDILIRKAQPGMALEHRQKHGQTVGIEPACLSLGATQDAGRGQGLDFGKKAA